ncbi:uncharacterized protein LOC136080860 [Hydra vulgaris]|uniref:Uncharacterized protein LOC136080860 n=1 Tax=Hydra vulgaris TaxID=6087 RepID=A0ABM4BYE3_HYDVU
MSKFCRIINSIYKRLNELSCPFLENINEHSLPTLLFDSNNLRFELLKWVVCTFDPVFEEFLEASNYHTELFQQKLITALSILLHSSTNYAELLSGKASQKNQLKFWDDLIDILYTSHFGYSYSNSLSNKDLSSKCCQSFELTETFLHTCKFIDTLIHEHKPKELFSNDVHLFNIEIESQCKKQPVPSLTMLIEATEKMKEDLVTKTNELESLVKSLNFKELENHNVENYCFKFDLSLKKLLQMVNLFIYSFESDLEIWCNQPKLELSNIGPSIKSLTGLMRHYCSINDNLSILKKNSSHFVDILKERRKWNDENLLKPSSLTQLREEINILKQSISRKYSK